MKIRDVHVRTVIAPLDPPVRTASGHVTQAPLVLIDLATDAGVTGRSYLFGYHPFTLAPLRALVTSLGEVADQRVGESLGAADVACDDGAGVDADAVTQRRVAGLATGVVPGGQGAGRGRRTRPRSRRRCTAARGRRGFGWPPPSR